MAGAVLSILFTLNVHDEKFELASVAVSVIVVVPVPETVVPAMGDCVTVIDPVAVQLSLFVASER